MAWNIHHRRRQLATEGSHARICNVHVRTLSVILDRTGPLVKGVPFPSQNTSGTLGEPSGQGDSDHVVWHPAIVLLVDFEPLLLGIWESGVIRHVEEAVANMIGGERPNSVHSSTSLEGGRRRLGRNISTNEGWVIKSRNWSCLSVERNGGSLVSTGGSR